jgi:hypothetical protein
MFYASEATAFISHDGLAQYRDRMRLAALHIKDCAKHSKAALDKKQQQEGSKKKRGWKGRTSSRAADEDNAAAGSGECEDNSLESQDSQDSKSGPGSSKGSNQDSKHGAGSGPEVPASKKGSSKDSNQGSSKSNSSKDSKGSPEDNKEGPGEKGGKGCTTEVKEEKAEKEVRQGLGVRGGGGGWLRGPDIRCLQLCCIWNLQCSGPRLYNCGNGYVRLPDLFPLLWQILSPLAPDPNPRHPETHPKIPHPTA